MPASPTHRNILGKRIRTLRQKAKPPLTQKALAVRVATHGAYMDRTALARIEIGDRVLRDFEIVAIAKALHVRVTELFKK